VKVCLIFVKLLDLLVVLSGEIWQFHHWFDRRFAHGHGTYTLELHCLWSVPGSRWTRGYSHPGMYIRHAGVQIPHRAVSHHWLFKLLWAGGLYSP